MAETGKRPTVAVLATFDTKGDAGRYLAARIRAAGVDVLLIDMSLTGDHATGADVTRADLAARGALDAAVDGRPKAMESMADALEPVLADLVERGAIDGAIGIGGGTGGWIAGRAFDALPFGFPRLVVTTVVKPSGEHDTVYLPSVVDVAGLNALLRPVLRNAAGAISGMVSESSRPDAAAEAGPGVRPSIAMTMFGVTTAGGEVAMQTLEAAGYDVVVFHATGAGGRTMERLVADGHFVGVLDWTTTELVQHATGGLCDAGPDRMRTSDGSGVPRVVVPGAVDVINVLPPVPEAFADRATHWHLPTVPLVRSSADETAAAGRWVGEALSGAAAPSLVVVPGGGFSALDTEDGVFADPSADAAFAAGVRETGGEELALHTSPHNINDPRFAREAAQALLELLESTEQPTADKE